MNPFIQGESSGVPSIHLEKRRRGRPKKDPSLKNIPREADDGRETVVGQPVSGFVEASFDAGYLLTVKIGNTSTNLRGVVFKPGHFVPVTAENDVAPHLQMIRRNDIYFPGDNPGWSRRPKLGIRKAGAKRKLTAPKPDTSAGVRGNVVPVTLQHVDFAKGASHSSSATPHLRALGDKDVHMVEPLSIMPPDKAIPGVSLPFNDGTSSFGQGEKIEPTESTDDDDMTSSDLSESQTENGKEEEEDDDDDYSGVNDAKQESSDAFHFQTAPMMMDIGASSVHSISPPNPLFTYGTGSMTELLQAVQENIKEKQVQTPDHQKPSGSNVELSEPKAHLNN